MRSPSLRGCRMAALALCLILGCRAESAAAQARNATAGTAPDRPNIVIIMADDMGYTDIAPYGGEIRTPNLDRLAAGGVRFRQFYNNAKCSPTRASLLTGLYPQQVGMAELAPGRGKARAPGPFQGYLPTDAPTIAEVLHTAGYRTYMSGKWHVGDDPEHWPRARGFDRYFGLISGASSYYEILKLPDRVREMVLEDSLWTPPATGYYATDAYTDYAVDRIREHHAEHASQPFFLYLAYTAPHFPLHALPEDIARYRGRYDIGWDSLRLERFARMRRLGIIDDRYPLPPRPVSVPAWTEAKEQVEWARRMEVYAAMIDRMDQGIGRVLEALEETGVSENTLVLFLSDNGATQENVAGRGLNDPAVPIGARGSYLSILEPWANVSNTPFRLYKNWVHEGGIITPLIAYWPRRIHGGGSISDEYGHVIDLLPTVIDLARTKYPGPRSLPGRSLLPAFQGEPLNRSEPLFWAYNGNWAIREGSWKLAYDRVRTKRVELFDLGRDPNEQHDIAAANPARAAAMQREWEAWADRVGARERSPD